MADNFKLHKLYQILYQILRHSESVFIRVTQFFFLMILISFSYTREFYDFNTTLLTQLLKQ